MTDKITHLVFDLGGVIVKLRGAPILDAWTGAHSTAEKTWEKWLTSEAPRAFESGQIGADDFAEQIIDELSLNVDASTFLEYFTMLPIGPYEGAIEWLQSLKPHYTTALFSNSNVIHWQRKMSEMKLGPVFHHHFASHLMGKVKPDHEAFEYVLNELAVPAGKVLFFDDNQMNVDAARQLGMQAERVVGFDALRLFMESRLDPTVNGDAV